eukprot:scaffold53560_cov28-Phaeocystis_antarctica.AAC.1
MPTPPQHAAPPSITLRYTHTPLRYAAMKRELVEDISNIVEQLDARVHLRSRYGFLLARWRPTAF